MGFAPKSLFLDLLSGYFDMALFEQLGDSNAGLWGKSINWGPVTGSWRRDVKGMLEIVERRGITIGIGANIEPKSLKTTIGFDEKGKPIKDSAMVGWQLKVPGRGHDTVLNAFDEVYHLVTVPTETGSNPNRKLITNPYTLHDYDFECKSRKGVQGPIVNPTYEKIIAAVKKGNYAPRTFVVCGGPGVGKTTLFDSFPRPILAIDIQGGWEEQAKKPDTKVIKPQKLSEVWDVLKSIRDRGEI